MSLRTGWERVDAPRGRAHAVDMSGALCATPIHGVTVTEGWPPADYADVCSGCMQLARANSRQSSADPAVVFQAADGAWYVGRPMTHKIDTTNGDTLADAARAALRALGLDAAVLRSDDPVTLRRFLTQAGLD